MRLNLLVLISSLAFVGCGDIFYAEVEIPELCSAQGSQTFDAAPVAFHGTLTHDFEYNLGSALPDSTGKNLEGVLQLLRMNMKSTSSNGLDFIEKLDVNLLGPAGTELPATTLVHYDKANSTDPSEVVLTGDRFDILPYIENGSVHFQTSLTGSLPEHQWDASFESCFYLKAKVKYMELVTQGGLPQ